MISLEAFKEQLQKSGRQNKFYFKIDGKNRIRKKKAHAMNASGLQKLKMGKDSGPRRTTHHHISERSPEKHHQPQT